MSEETVSPKSDEIDMEEFTPKVSKEDFAKTVEIIVVTPEEFFSRMRKIKPDASVAQIERAKGYNYKNASGKSIALIKKEAIPYEYLHFVQEHELWEAYAGSPDGLDMDNMAVNQIKELLKKSMPHALEDDLKRLAIQIYNHNLHEYNFAFKHEYAVLKEYQLAEEEGTLEEWHQFVMSMRQNDLEKHKLDPMVMRATQNDISIRTSIYSKIKNGTKHEFLKKMPKISA